MVDVKNEAGESSLVIFTRADAMLAKADTIQKAKEFRDVALTAADWAKRKGMGEQAIAHCKTYAARAEVRLGELLIAGEKRGEVATTGHEPTGAKKKRVSYRHAHPATAADLGLSRKQKAEAKMLAGLPKDEQTAVVEGHQTKTQARRKAVARRIAKKVSLPSAKYRVLYADPPWSYGNTQPDYHPEQRDHYPVMQLKDICAMDIKAICEDNAVLFLWVTSPILEESFQVVKAWGFKYKTSFVWDKIKHNMGHYNSVRHEFLLVCVRGSCQPDVTKLFDSVQTIERTGHSVKPVQFYTIIETLYPHGKRIELFARSKRDGWDGYGNQA